MSKKVVNSAVVLKCFLFLIIPIAIHGQFKKAEINFDTTTENHQLGFLGKKVVNPFAEDQSELFGKTDLITPTIIFLSKETMFLNKKQVRNPLEDIAVEKFLLTQLPPKNKMPVFKPSKSFKSTMPILDIPESFKSKTPVFPIEPEISSEEES